jgi:glycosyltransferase involved in cell wall biosynthesis
VFKQTWQPFEIIVINDGSNDGSKQVITGMRHPLVKLINQQNMGVSSARNRGIHEAKGDWIAFLDADDIWKPEYLSKIVNLSRKYPNCSVYATSYILLDAKGNEKKIILKKIPFIGEDGILDNYFCVSSCSHPPLWTSAVVAKKESLLAINCFTVGVSSGEDLLTWAKLAINYQIGYSLEHLSIFCLDPAHTYNKRPNRIPQTPDLVGDGLIKIANDNVHIPGLKDYIALWFKMRASIYLRLGKKKLALKEIVKSISFSRRNYKVYCYVLSLLFPSVIINKFFQKFAN